jgi:NADH-quinone oxidoreductase subunit H
VIHLLATDPLLDKVDWVTILFVVIKAVITFAVLLVTVLLTIWWERKLISYMQNRVGPQEAGPFGLLQSLADGVKVFFKEALLPRDADRTVFRIAPYLAVVPAFLTFAIVPIGGPITIGHRTTLLQLADPPVGILWMLAMSGIAIYGVMLAGWSSGSKYPLLGSVRASAQMVSYEAALGLSIAGVILISGSLSTHDIVAAQATRGIGGVLPNWNVIQLAFVPFIIFMMAATAEMNRPPFDLTEADSELVGGYMTEYSSIGFAFFYLAEFMNLVTMSGIMVTLFFGGPAGPWNPHAAILRWLLPIVYFVAKVCVFISVYVWIRATLPRLRYDQLMDLGWKVLIPIALFWLLVIAAIKVGRWPYAVGAAAAGLVAFLLLSRALAVGKSRAEEQRAEDSSARRSVGGSPLSKGGR